jgi:hypothetical protein
MDGAMSELGHFDSEIYALDERIGRLALVCGADLSREDVVVGLIKGRFDVCAHRDSIPAAARAELRHLLMMKYRIELSCIDSIGAGECARLIRDQDERLRRRGFPPQSIPDKQG